MFEVFGLLTSILIIRLALIATLAHYKIFVASSLFLKIRSEKELENTRFFVSIKVGLMAKPLISWRI